MARPLKFKQAIYDSATKLFGERGLAETGVREIAKDAGVSEAALYRHWKGKKELARDIFIDGMAQLQTRLVADVPTDGPACYAIRGVVRIFFETYDTFPDAVHFLLMNQHVVWRTIDRDEPNPVNFWFNLLRERAAQFELVDEAADDIIGPVTLGMILRPGIAASYGSIPRPLSQHIDKVSLAICRVVGTPWCIGVESNADSTPTSSIVNKPPAEIG